MTTVFAIANQKGGVGKTTSSVNLAASLAATKKRVLLIDIDPQGNATSGSGVDKHSVESTIYEVLVDELPIEQAMIGEVFMAFHARCQAGERRLRRGRVQHPGFASGLAVEQQHQLAFLFSEDF